MSDFDDLEWAQGVLDGTIETYGETGRRRTGRGRWRGRGRGRGRGRRTAQRPDEESTRRAVREPLAVFREMNEGAPDARLSDLLLMSQAESLMAWGAGRHYERCATILRSAVVAPLVKGRLFWPLFSASNSGDPSVTEIRTSALDITRRGAEPSVPVLLLAHELGQHPAGFDGGCTLRELGLDLPRFEELQDSGSCAAWFSAVFVFFEMLEKNWSQNLPVRRVNIRLPPLEDGREVARAMQEVFVRGMLALFAKLVILAEFVAKAPGGGDSRLTVAFVRSTGGYEELHGMWTQGFAGRVDELRVLTPGQKMAFVMGLHDRLGDASPVGWLNRDTVELVLERVERLRLDVVWELEGLTNEPMS